MTKSEIIERVIESKNSGYRARMNAILVMMATEGLPEFDSRRIRARWTATNLDKIQRRAERAKLAIASLTKGV